MPPFNSLRRVFSNRWPKHSRRNKRAFSTEARHPDVSLAPTISGWTVARQALETLGPLVGTIPALGVHIQALIDTTKSVIYVIECTRSWKAGRAELCRKIQYVLGIVADALDNRSNLCTPDLIQDLEAFTETLQGIQEFLDKRKGPKLFRYFTSIADYERVLDFSGRFDDAVKMLLLKSSIQTRLDIQALKQSTESLNESLQRSVEQAAGTLESMVTTNNEKLVEIQSGMSSLVEGDRKRNYCDCSGDSDFTKIRDTYKVSTRDEEPGGVFLSKEESFTGILELLSYQYFPRIYSITATYMQCWGFSMQGMRLAIY